MLTGRDRILAVLNREPVDRVPIDFIATPEMERKLIRELGLADGAALRARCGADIVRVGPVAKSKVLGEYYGHLFVRQISETRFLDNWGITWEKAQAPTGDVYYDVVDFPLKATTDARVLEDYPWPDPRQDWDFSGIPGQIAAHHDGQAVMSGTSAVFDDSWRMSGLENFLCALAAEPAFARLLLRQVCNYWLEYAKAILEAGAGKIDVMGACDDLGTQNGLLISRSMCQDYVMPLLRERVALFKSFGAHAFMHSCGGICDIIPDLIECGVEILNPIQPRARGMDRKKIKRDFGGRLVLHGSIDQQQVLVFGTPSDVAQETRECIDILGAGGGYIVAGSHVLESDIPVANVVAMFDTAREHGEAKRVVG